MNETLKAFLTEGKLGAVGFGMTDREVYAALGPPPAWFAMPGTIGSWHESDPWKSKNWYYDNHIVGYGFDELRKVNVLLVDLLDDGQHALPHWFIGWFPQRGIKIEQLKAHLKKENLPYRDHLFGNAYWLLIAERAYALVLSQSGSPDEREIAGIIHLRDKRDLQAAIPGTL
jgi:hypothetical protein